MNHEPFRERRDRHPRPKKVYLVIVCEGATESKYFDAVRRAEPTRSFFSIKPIDARGGSRDNIALRAMREFKTVQDESGRVCAVMDVEEPSHRRQLEVACNKLREAGIDVFLSHPSFEVWFLCHFEHVSKPFTGGQAVARHLSKLWKKRFGEEYSRTASNHYERLKEMLNDAVSNARMARERDHEGDAMCDANSSTEVYLLMSNLGCGGPQGKTSSRPEWKSPSPK